MKIELTKFKVKPGKSARVDEWMSVLRGHLPEVLLTLDREKMYVESIFREVESNSDYLYWFTIQGDSSASLIDSPHEIDKIHLAFWRECIDCSMPARDLHLEANFLPSKVADTMK